MLPITAVALVSTALMLFGTPQEKPRRTQPLGTLGVVMVFVVLDILMPTMPPGLPPTAYSGSPSNPKAQ